MCTVYILYLNDYHTYFLKTNQFIHFTCSSRHVRPSKFDFGHLAHELDEEGIFTQDERGIPHLDLAKFFDRINDFADQSALKKEIEEDSEYHPWKKEDVEKLTNLAMNDENAVSEAPTECK